MGGEGPLLCDPEQKAQLEANNGVEQIDYIAELVNTYKVQEVRESHVLELHSLAIQGIYPCGGKYRDAHRRVEIRGSSHEVPHESRVPGLVRDLLDQLNAERTTRSALDRAALALWRLNWIHPFAGGNGRTSRALTYLVLCMDLGAMMPGLPTVPSLIYDRRDDYVAALRVADAGALDGGAPDLTAMIDFLRDAVTRQLAGAIRLLARPSTP